MFEKKKKTKLVLDVYFVFPLKKKNTIGFWRVFCIPVNSTRFDKLTTANNS